jgi:acyl carrier protein
MMTHCENLVRIAVARQIAVDPGDVELNHELSRDLAITPLGLVLIALRIEEMAGSEFPVERLEHVRRVRDLATLVRAGRSRRDELSR